MQLPPIEEKKKKFTFQSARASSGWKPAVKEGLDRLMELTFAGDVLGFQTALELEITRRPDLINYPDEQNGNVPLHIAASKGDADMVAFMLRKRANIDAQDFFGNTPLFYAIDKGRNEVCYMLVRQGASVSIADFRGNTPLHVAALKNNEDMVKLFLSRGVDPEIPNNSNLAPSKLTSVPRIATLIEAAAQSRLDGNTDSKSILSWMGFGIGLGVGLGVAMAKKQEEEREKERIAAEAKAAAEAERRRLLAEERAAKMTKKISGSKERKFFP